MSRLDRYTLTTYRRRIACRAVLLLSLLYTVGCTDGTVYHTYRPVPEKGWAHTDTLSYSLPARLTGKTFCMDIELRYKETYPYRDVWVEVWRPLTPSLPPDTVHLVFADERGNWKGNGRAGNLHQYAAKAGNRQLMPADSLLQIIPIMNDTLLKGITDVGIRLSLPPGIDAQKDK